MKLTSMTDFVLEQNRQLKNAPNAYDQYCKIVNYAQFLKQPLTLGMFIPCDGDENVLEIPIDIYYRPDFDCQKFPQECYEHDLKIYDDAKSKVIFSEFRVVENDSKSHPKTVQFQNLVNTFWFLTETNSWHISKGIKKVEDLIPYNLDLSVSF